MAGGLAPAQWFSGVDRAPIMSSIQHWTPAYLKSRTRQALYELCHHHGHWLCPDALRFLDAWLGPTDIGFQWGTGDSTLWLAKRVQHLTSIEHNPAQARQVRVQLRVEGLNERVSYHLESHGNAKQHIDAAYVRMIDMASDHSLSFSVIGGPLPSACCLASILKLKPGGLLIVEHAERHLSDNGELASTKPNWEDVAWHLARWRRIWTTNGLSEAAIFVKP